MSSLIKHKRVEFTELFYDLVFVYAISKTTALIHHLHRGIVDWESMSAFLITLLVLVNSWMIQTVFTNRYGKNSLLNIIIMFINMAMLLLISSMIVNEWKGYFNYFCWSFGTLSLTLFIQYLIEFKRKEHTKDEKHIIKGFLLMTGLRTLAIYIAALFPLNIGFPIYLIGIIVTFIMPLVFGRRTSNFYTNIPHLIERISLLVIITFGEMVMGITEFFTPESFSLNSILYFLMMALLFIYYFGQFDHAIDEAAYKRGIYLIYSHYPIFVGLIMITVSMSFLAQIEANHHFIVSFLYVGIFLFQWAVLSHSRFNKEYLRFNKTFFIVELLIPIVGFILSLIFAMNSNIVILITTIMLFILEFHFTYYYIKLSSKCNKIDWVLF